MSSTSKLAPYWLPAKHRGILSAWEKYSSSAGATSRHSGCSASGLVRLLRDAGLLQGCFTEDAVRSAFVEAAHDDAGKLPFRSFYAVLDALGHQAGSLDVLQKVSDFSSSLASVHSPACISAPLPAALSVDNASASTSPAWSINSKNQFSNLGNKDLDNPSQSDPLPLAQSTTVEAPLGRTPRGTVCHGILGMQQSKAAPRANARPEHFSAGGCAAQAKHIRPATAVTASILGEPRRASSSSSEGTARLQMDQQQECLTLMGAKGSSAPEASEQHSPRGLNGSNDSSRRQSRADGASMSGCEGRRGTYTGSETASAVIKPALGQPQSSRMDANSATRQDGQATATLAVSWTSSIGPFLGAGQEASPGKNKALDFDDAQSGHLRASRPQGTLEAALLATRLDMEKQQGRITQLEAALAQVDTAKANQNRVLDVGSVQAQGDSCDVCTRALPKVSEGQQLHQNHQQPRQEQQSQQQQQQQHESWEEEQQQQRQWLKALQHKVDLTSSAAAPQHLKPHTQDPREIEGAIREELLGLLGPLEKQLAALQLQVDQQAMVQHTALQELANLQQLSQEKPGADACHSGLLESSVPGQEQPLHTPGVELQKQQEQQLLLDKLEALQLRMEALAEAHRASAAQQLQQLDRLKALQQRIDELAEAHQSSATQQPQQQQQQHLLDRLEAFQQRMDALEDARLSSTTQQPQQQQQQQQHEALLDRLEALEQKVEGLVSVPPSLAAQEPQTYLPDTQPVQGADGGQEAKEDSPKALRLLEQQVAEMQQQADQQVVVYKQTLQDLKTLQQQFQEQQTQHQVGTQQQFNLEQQLAALKQKAEQQQQQQQHQQEQCGKWRELLPSDVQHQLQQWPQQQQQLEDAQSRLESSLLEMQRQQQQDRAVLQDQAQHAALLQQPVEGGQGVRAHLQPHAAEVGHTDAQWQEEQQQQQKQQQQQLGLPAEVESLRLKLQSLQHELRQLTLIAGPNSLAHPASGQQQAGGSHPLPESTGTQPILGAPVSEHSEMIQAAIEQLDKRVQAGLCQLEDKAREATSLLQKLACTAAERAGEDLRTQARGSGGQPQPAAGEAHEQEAPERAASATSLQLQQLNADAADFVQQLTDQAAAAQRRAAEPEEQSSASGKHPGQGAGQDTSVLVGREGFCQLARLVSSMGAAIQEADERLSRLEPSHKALQGTVANLRLTTLDTVVSLMDRPSFKSDGPFALQADVIELRGRLNRLDWKVSRQQQVPFLRTPSLSTSTSGNQAALGGGQSMSAEMACASPPPLLKPAMSMNDVRTSLPGAVVPYAQKSSTRQAPQKEPGPLQRRISMMDGEGSKSTPINVRVHGSSSGGSSSEGIHASNTPPNLSLSKGHRGYAQQQAFHRAQTDQGLEIVSEVPRETALKWTLLKENAEKQAQQESGLQKRKSSGGVRFSGAGAGAEPRRQRQSHIGGDPYSGSTFAGSFSRRRRPSHIEEELTESRRGSVFGSRRASLEDEAETDSASAAPTVFASPWAAAHVRTS